MQIRSLPILLRVAGPSFFGRTTPVVRAARPGSRAASSLSSSSSRLAALARAAPSILTQARAPALSRSLTSTNCRRQDAESATPAAWTSASNYFEILDLPVEGSFDLDEGALKRTFLLKSRLVHPDGFKGASEEEYQAAQQQSAFLNTAYEALKSPFSRAQYLLSLQDVHVNETDAVSDQELLIDIMDAREAIDDAQSEEEVEALRDQHRQRARAAIEGLSSAFKDGDLQRARDLTIELRYWLNVDTAGKDKIHPNE